MGFTTGFTGGVTLTLGIAYLTILSHQRNRQAQALYLRSQSQLLNSLVEPTPLYPLSRAEVFRTPRSSFTDNAKDRWNAEVQNAVRWLQTADWNRAREGMEGAIARALGVGLQKSREGIEEAENKIDPIAKDAWDKSKAAASRTMNQAARGVDRVSEAGRKEVKQGTASIGEESKELTGKARGAVSATNASTTRAILDVKERIKTTAESTREAVRQDTEKAQDAAAKAQAEVTRHSVGTVDVVRGVLRSAVGKGIEKGKDLVGKSQEVIGEVTNKLKPASTSIGTKPVLSPVEKALQQRYEQRPGLEKSVAEVLEERYKPLDRRDNTVLRGL